MVKKLDTVLIVDFGGQYCHLIARRIREQNVYSDIVPPEIITEKFQTENCRINVKGLIFSGGPSSVYEQNAPRIDPRILNFGIPILGLCYGHQLIAQMAGGKVEPAVRKEYGIATVIIDHPVGVLKGLDEKEQVWMSHGDTVVVLPSDYEVLAHSDNTPIAAFRNKQKPIYGLQWHPEVIHTEHGTEMLCNFLFDVCKCKPNWSIEDFIESSIEKIKRITNMGKAIVALSGGIDSSTATALAARALGKKLTAVFIDHGFMREGEPEFVESTFSKMGLNFVSVDAKDRFMQRLKNASDPEEKRRIVGREFIRIFEAQAKEFGAEYLIQGTIYPDRVESGFRKLSAKIKTHHNVAGLPTRIRFKGVVEPLSDLYKDEVKKVAGRLGLPKEIIQRQPFPGPGLVVRITGEVTREKVEILRKADKIVTDEIEKTAPKCGLWQYFAVLIDTKSTGVKGDARAYGYTVAVRSVESREGMTAKFAKIPYDILERISTRITNEIPQVARVVYDITHKPPATIEWE
ncbi:MAG: glutamine-hydrolyzing GMP synthase [Candidatus Bathycorpusculaceae bacterium]